MPVAAEPVVASGYCGAEEDGQNVQWTLTQNNLPDSANPTYTLTLSGAGAVKDVPSEGDWLSYADKITIINVGEGIKHLGSNLVRNTIKVEVNLPASLESMNIGGLVSGTSVSTFGNNYASSDGESGIGKIIVADGNTAFKMQNGVLFNYDGTILLRYTNEAPEDYVLPPEVTTLAAKAFSRNSHLKSVDLNNGKLTVIYGDQFGLLTNTEFTKLVIPSTVTTLEDGSIVGECPYITTVEIQCASFSQNTIYDNSNSALKTIILSDDCTSIPNRAFYKMSNLETLTLPSNLASIGKEAFQGTKLQVVRFPGTVTFVGVWAFKDTIHLSVVDFTALSDDVSLYQGGGLFGYSDTVPEADRITKIGYVATDAMLTKVQQISSQCLIYAHTNGGTFPTDYIFEAGKLATPTKSGYVFDGWYTNEALTTPLAENAVLTAKSTYYAKWESSAYTVTPDTVDFGELTYDYSSSAFQGKTITVNSAADPSIKSVHASKYFDTAVSGLTVTITPKLGLGVGTYTENITITTGDTATYDVTATVKVTKANQILSFANPAISKLEGAEPFTNAFSQSIVDEKILYMSSNETVATVNADGEVTVGIEGSATITAKAVGTKNYTEAIETYKLTVHASDSADSIICDVPGYVVAANPVSKTQMDIVNESIKAEHAEKFAGKEILWIDVSLFDANGIAIHNKEITFIVKYPSGITFANSGEYEFVVLHLDVVSGEVTQVPSDKVKPVENGLQITSTVSPFAIGYGEKPDDKQPVIDPPTENKPSDSTPQGSVVWLTETPTPTPSETVTPTETIPTTQPTPTETEAESPLSVLGVIAGLGAVAVLRRK